MPARKAFGGGLSRGKSINMAEALNDFIGSGGGPGDLSSNKEYFRNFGRFPAH